MARSQRGSARRSGSCRRAPSSRESMKRSAKRWPAARRSRRRRLLVSCEHGGNRVPAAYAPLFADAADVLATHRGYDLGALEVARAFGRRLGVTPVTATTTRLVVDLN